MNKILIVDDEEPVRAGLRDILKAHGFAPIEAASGKEALNIFSRTKPDAVLLDLRMPGMDGMETLREFVKLDPEVPVIMITAYGEVDSAVEAMKLGAYDFFAKPPEIDRLITSVKRAVQKFDLERKIKQLDTAVESSLEWLLGRSRAMKKVIEQIRQVAWSDMSVIIQGETGTGKSFVARAIHTESSRNKRPFITVDMGVIPETLVESELFGHEKGAFTGADRKRVGHFMQAKEGTLFIDEVQNMTNFVQSKLLRTVEQKKVYPLGSTKGVNVNVRIIAATNVSLKQAMKQKKFRADLFFRLGEFLIVIPPLRERGEDILVLAEKFLTEAGSEFQKPVRGINESAQDLLRQYHWPGNVRELKNIIRRAVLLSTDGVLTSRHLDSSIHTKQLVNAAGFDNKVLKPTVEINWPLPPLKDISAIAVRDVEMKVIKEVLIRTGGNKSKAAALLQVDYKTILAKIKTYGF